MLVAAVVVAAALVTFSARCSTGVLLIVLVPTYGNNWQRNKVNDLANKTVTQGAALTERRKWKKSKSFVYSYSNRLERSKRPVVMSQVCV